MSTHRNAETVQQEQDRIAALVADATASPYLIRPGSPLDRVRTDREADRHARASVQPADRTDNLAPGDYRRDDRVELHPATDAWMFGDRYGAVVLIGRKYVHVLMDRSGRTLKVQPRNILGKV